MVKHDTLLICSGVRENRLALRCVFADRYNLLEAGDVGQLTLLLQQNLDCVAAILLDVSGWEETDTEWMQQEQKIAERIKALWGEKYK